MKISTRGRYGIRMLLDLADRKTETPTILADIAKNQNISVSYLEQIAVLLSKAGFIRSIVGASGGFELVRDSSTITVGEVLRVLEGDLSVIDELQPGETETALQSCIRKKVYEPLNDRIAQLLDSRTLDSMKNTVDSQNCWTYII
ncbi:MAG TPA: Rrf2 family transcriptional regulator [Treponemataceae bacterium]|nr:Rrf2 family transcriptional regulator [Treponemataceae bacterium]